eukprot:scaffold536_cov409-Prasinococcus_capsulatus_cf.AAC.6
MQVPAHLASCDQADRRRSGTRGEGVAVGPSEGAGLVPLCNTLRPTSRHVHDVPSPARRARWGHVGPRGRVEGHLSG